MTTPRTSYRVAQWATGNVGSRAMRRVIEHPNMQLVGCYVHSINKAGRDAGELCGIAPMGVKATNAIADIIALRPDCVLYMPHVLSYDDLCALLESGANVVSTRMELHNPAAMEPAIRARIEAACAAGNSSLHATGSSPGFISEAMPIVLASIQRRLDCLTISEFADCSSRNSPEMLFEMMGFGAAPDPAACDGGLHHLQSSFGPSLSLIADALGLPIDGFATKGALGVARNDVHIAAGIVPKGTVAATRMQLMAMRNGQVQFKFVANWYVSDDVETSDGEDWDFRTSGWRVQVDGDCPMDIGISFPVSEADYPEMTPGLTAHRPVNAIPYVCDAPAGIQTTVSLPQIIARLG
jgi:2,4-diaminopentanoate dehydrogenase